MQILLDLGGADLGGTGQVNYLAAILKEVKFAFPVITHNKGVNSKFLNVGNFLVPVFLGNNKVNVSDGFEHLFAILIREVAFLLLLVPVELIGGQHDDQIIAVFFGTAKQIDMTIMK
jgi:hypothetical protein